MLVQTNYQMMKKQVNFKGELTQREANEFKQKIAHMSSHALKSLQEKTESTINSAIGDGFPGFVKKEKEELRLINAELCTRMTIDGDYKEPKMAIWY